MVQGLFVHSIVVNLKDNPLHLYDFGSLTQSSKFINCCFANSFNYWYQGVRMCACTMQLYIIGCLYISLVHTVDWQSQHHCSAGDHVLPLILWSSQSCLFCSKAGICS